MSLDVREFYQATNPSKTLRVDENQQDWKYYIDFSSVRGGQVIKELKKQITFWSPDEPTCQLFTGHRGCGKSTELRRLKAELEKEGFQVVYFESDESLEMGDVDISDILLTIARRVDKSFEEAEIKIISKGFIKLLNDVVRVLSSEVKVFNIQTPVGKAGYKKNQNQTSISFLIGELTLEAKESPEFRQKLRGYLEPGTNRLLDTINTELLEPGIDKLKKQQGKKGLVVIVDNLDRLAATAKDWGRNQQEYIFVDRGEQLRRLNCHVVYTMPLALTFSNEFGQMTQGFSNPNVLPMVPVQLRDGNQCEEGMFLLQQMVLAKAFPEMNAQERLDKITEIFALPETLEHLCRISGGHVRNLLKLLNNSIRKEDKLPISRRSLDEAIQDERNSRIRAITNDEWNLLRQVRQQKKVTGGEQYETLIRSMFVYEYQDSEGSWFAINPILEDAKELSDE